MSKGGLGSVDQAEGKSAKALPWFRLSSEVIDDERLLQLSCADRWHFIALLSCKARGLLDKGDAPCLRDRKVAMKLGITLDDLGSLISRLAEVGLVERLSLQPAMHLVVPRENLRPVAAIWAVIRARIFKRDDYTCQYCGARGVKLECDHVVPVALGGGHEDENLATACLRCNRSKGHRILSVWRALA